MNNLRAGFWQLGMDEAVKRIESFKVRPVLRMRLGLNTLSDEYYNFACKIIDTQIKLLNMKGTEKP